MYKASIVFSVNAQYTYIVSSNICWRNSNKTKEQSASVDVSESTLFPTSDKGSSCKMFEWTEFRGVLDCRCGATQLSVLNNERHVGMQCWTSHGDELLQLGVRSFFMPNICRAFGDKRHREKFTGTILVTEWAEGVCEMYMIYKNKQTYALRGDGNIW